MAVRTTRSFQLQGVADLAGGPAGLLIPLGVVAGVLALGAWVFAREAPRMAENV
jgi:hypothetical protein